MVGPGDVAKQEQKPTAVDDTTALDVLTVVQGDGVVT
jgi:hypothetical protein